MSDVLCSKCGCDYNLDLDGKVTCSNCGSTNDAKTSPKWGDTPESFEE